MKNKNLIVFDIDGTLTDSVTIHQKAFREMLAEIGVKNDSSDFKSFKHHTDSFIAKEIYESDEVNQFTESKRVEFERGLTEKISSERIEEVKGAKEIIKHLEENTDFGVCYATGSLLRPAKFKLESIGVNYEERLLIASDHIYEREQIVSDAIHAAKEVYSVNDFDRIISIGDGLWDLITARKLNLEFIGIGNGNKTLLEENGADLVLDDLTKLRLE